MQSLIPLFILLVAIIIFSVIAYIAYSIVQEVGKNTRSKMEKKNVMFTRDGVKVGVKELTEEDYVDRSQSILVNIWNHTSFPAYKSRLWNMTGSTAGAETEKRKPKVVHHKLSQAFRNPRERVGPETPLRLAADRQSWQHVVGHVLSIGSCSYCVTRETRRNMSLSSIKGLLSNYSPVSESLDLEKIYHYPLRNASEDLESASGSEANKPIQREGGEKKESKIIDGRTVSDAIIGLSDGLTVPFALTAGLSALGDTKVVVFGGLAELIAGAISMGLGGYLGAKSEEESYRATLKETRNKVVADPSATTETISEIFAPYDLPSELVSQLTDHLSASPMLPSFLMNFHHTLPEPSGSRALICALTIALGYFIGGFVPLLPYFFVGPHDAFIALRWSIATMAIALFLFGYGKTCFVSGWRGRQNIRRGFIGGMQMVLVGGVAAGSAMGLVKGFQLLASIGEGHGEQ
ncbi:VIT family-domain-containing protein [Aspergillus fumigatus]